MITINISKIEINIVSKSDKDWINEIKINPKKILDGITEAAKRLSECSSN